MLAYLAKPGRVMDCEKKSLSAFAKTKLLAPGESQSLTLPFPLSHIAAFDEARGAFVLESGEYGILLNGEVCGRFALPEEKVFPAVREAREPAFSPRVQKLLRALSDRDKIALVTGGGYPLRAYNNVMGAAGRTCTGLLKKGVPNIVLADGPAGLNVLPESAVQKNGFPGYLKRLPLKPLSI